MKKIILLPLALCAVVLCGCERSADTAKIDSLTQKVDTLVQGEVLISSNQVILFNELGAVKTQVAELPKQFDSMAYYYQTNTLAHTQDQLDVQSKLSLLILTNLWRLELGQASKMGP